MKRTKRWKPLLRAFWAGVLAVPFVAGVARDGLAQGGYKEPERC